MHRTRVALAGAALAVLALSCAEGSAGNGSVEPSGKQLRVQATDQLRFVPATLSVPAGTFTVLFQNKGTIEHQFAVSGSDRGHGAGAHGANDTGQIRPGESKRLQLTLQEGTYEYACHVPGHFEAGMKGTLVVGSGGHG